MRDVSFSSDADLALLTLMPHLRDASFSSDADLALLTLDSLQPPFYECNLRDARGEGTMHHATGRIAQLAKMENKRHGGPGERRVPAYLGL